MVPLVAEVDGTAAVTYANIITGVFLLERYGGHEFDGPVELIEALSISNG